MTEPAHEHSFMLTTISLTCKCAFDWWHYSSSRRRRMMSLFVALILAAVQLYLINYQLCYWAWRWKSKKLSHTTFVEFISNQHRRLLHMETKTAYLTFIDQKSIFGQKKKTLNEFSSSSMYLFSVHLTMMTRRSLNSSLWGKSSKIICLYVKNQHKFGNQQFLNVEYLDIGMFSLVGCVFASSGKNQSSHAEHRIFQIEFEMETNFIATNQQHFPKSKPSGYLEFATCEFVYR